MGASNWPGEQAQGAQSHGWHAQFGFLSSSLMASSAVVRVLPAPGIPTLHPERRTSGLGITLRRSIPYRFGIPSQALSLET